MQTECMHSAVATAGKGQVMHGIQYLSVVCNCSFVLNTHPFPISIFQRIVCHLIQAAWKMNVNITCFPLLIIVVILAVIMGVVMPNFITVRVAIMLGKKKGRTTYLQFRWLLMKPLLQWEWKVPKRQNRYPISYQNINRDDVMPPSMRMRNGMKVSSECLKNE